MCISLFKDKPVIYTLFGKTVEADTPLYRLCEKYYGDYCRLERDMEAEGAKEWPDLNRGSLMLDIRDAFWCNEFRTEEASLRKKILKKITIN